jgi:hypothetical protein
LSLRLKADSEIKEEFIATNNINKSPAMSARWHIGTIPYAIGALFRLRVPFTGTKTEVAASHNTRG